MTHAKELTLQRGRKATAVPSDAGIRHRDPTTKGLGVLREQRLD